MSVKRVQYHYTECGLPNVFIEELRDGDGADTETIRIPNIRRLHALISECVLTSCHRLSGAELRYLRSEMGMTPAKFGNLLGHEPAEVTRWEETPSVDVAVEKRIRRQAALTLLGKTVSPLPEPPVRQRGVLDGEDAAIKIDASDPNNYRLVA